MWSYCFAHFRLKLPAKMLKFTTVVLNKYDVLLLPYPFSYYFYPSFDLRVMIIGALAFSDHDLILTETYLV